MDQSNLSPVTFAKPDVRREIFARWPRLRGSVHLALFGSRAAGVGRSDSDWDLFCVSQDNRFKAPDLDLVLRTPAQTEAPLWLGSELAHHIAAFGVWLTARPTWLDAILFSDRAADAKHEAIVETVRSVRGRWDRLLPTQRAKYLERVRRDLQRLHILAMRQPVPPTAFLDRVWQCAAAGSISGYASRTAVVSAKLVDEIRRLESFSTR